MLSSGGTDRQLLPVSAIACFVYYHCVPAIGLTPGQVSAMAFARLLAGIILIGTIAHYALRVSPLMVLQAVCTWRVRRPCCIFPGGKHGSAWPGYLWVYASSVGVCFPGAHPWRRSHQALDAGSSKHRVLFTTSSSCHQGGWHQYMYPFLSYCACLTACVLRADGLVACMST